MILLIQFILAHLIGDFLLQFDPWIKSKETRKARSPFLYIHILIHFLLILLITGGLNFWLPALIISLIHGVIDTTKIYLQKPSTQRRWFFADQGLHLVTILVVWYFTMLPAMALPIPGMAFWVIVTGIVFLTMPTSIGIAAIMAPWTQQLAIENEGALPKAGKYIGILERLLSFAFIAIGQWSAIGFLLAAKSIFRFGDLSRSKDRRLTEYILVGTLSSFGTAIILGILCHKLGVFIS